MGSGVIFGLNNISNIVMNRMMHIKLGAILAMIIWVFSSCEDYLTITDVENRAVLDDYYDSPQKVEQAVVGVYVDMRRGLLKNDAWLMYGEGRAGDLTRDVEYMDKIRAQQLIDGHRQIRELTDWSYFYDAINGANRLLNTLEETKADILSTYHYNLYRGEALALKSMAYFYLTRVWGEVPSAELSDQGSVLTQVEVLRRSAEWAQEARSLLPWMLINDDGIVSTALTEVRFNKTAASLLLAHQQLWLGEEQEAYKGLTQAFEGQNQDSLSHFGLSLGKDTNPQIPQDPYTDTEINITMENLDKIYPVDDTRRALFNIPASGTHASLIIDKQDMLMIYSKQEAQLLLAEAAWRSGQLEAAKGYLLEAAAGATEDYTVLTGDTFGDALLQERRRLLMGSGQRFFDLIRFKKVVEFLPFYTEGDLLAGAAYWPLSSQSMTSNGREQNGYWSR